MPITRHTGINQMQADPKGSEFFTGVFNTKGFPVDPFVTGFAFIKWVKVPSWLETAYPGFKQMTEKNFRALTGVEDMEIAALTIQAGFTPSEFQFAGQVSKSDGFTLTHNEFSGLPMTQMYTHWASGIRDPETGVATYEGEYSARNHCGELMYIVTRPDANKRTDGSIIEHAHFFTGVMPAKIPLSHLNYTAGQPETPPLEMTFFAHRHIGRRIDEAAVGILSQIESDWQFVNADDYGIQAGGNAGPSPAQ